MGEREIQGLTYSLIKEYDSGRRFQGKGSERLFIRYGSWKF